MDTFPGGSARVGLVHLVPMACRLVEVEGRCWATTEDRSFFPFLIGFWVLKLYLKCNHRESNNPHTKYEKEDVGQNPAW